MLIQIRRKFISERQVSEDITHKEQRKKNLEERYIVIEDKMKIYNMFRVKMREYRGWGREGIFKETVSKKFSEWWKLFFH